MSYIDFSEIVSFLSGSITPPEPDPWHEFRPLTADLIPEIATGLLSFWRPPSPHPLYNHLDEILRTWESVANLVPSLVSSFKDLVPGEQIPADHPFNRDRSRIISSNCGPLYSFYNVFYALTRNLETLGPRGVLPPRPVFVRPTQATVETALSDLLRAFPMAHVRREYGSSYELRVESPRVVLSHNGGESVDLGTFNLHLILDSGSWSLRVHAVNGVYCRHDEYVHPHVSSDDELCLGDGDQIFEDAIADFRYADALHIACSVLRTYNDHSPYRPLRYWLSDSSEYICERCSFSSDDPGIFYTAHDGEHLCEDCSAICSVCDEVFRSGQVTFQTRHGRRVCEGCLADFAIPDGHSEYWHVDDLMFDEDTERYYTPDDYDDLLAEREAESNPSQE